MAVSRLILAAALGVTLLAGVWADGEGGSFQSEGNYHGGVYRHNGGQPRAATGNMNNNGGNANTRGGSFSQGGSFSGSRGGEGGAGRASIAGDPIMTGFDGRSFEFMGEVGSYYSLISEHEHQISMRLMEGVMWDHVGTYMDGVGLKYKDHTVLVELAANDTIQVRLDGELLTMAAHENTQEHILGLVQGELMLVWQLHREDLGNAVEIVTDLVEVTVYLTPAGTLDEGGVRQPAYLNFDAALLGPPAGELTGIIGEGYGRMLAGAPQEPDDFKFHGDNSDYLMDSYFSAGHTNDVVGLATASGGGMSRKRRLVERVQVAFPLAFSSTGAARPHAAAGAAAAATNHRPRRALVETTAAPAKATARRPFFGSALTLRSLPLLGFTQ